MDMREYLQDFIGLLHLDYDDALRELTEDQFYFLPGDGVNHIAYMAWHILRAEDNIVQFVLQRTPTVWVEGKLDERWQLPRIHHNLPTEEAHAFRVPSIGNLMDYAREVWRHTEQYLARLSEAELQRLVNIPPWGEIPTVRLLGQAVIAHGRQHLGQIDFIRGLNGLPGLDAARF
jgi:hypothetical protein